MSIDDELDRLRYDGELKWLQPKRPRSPCVRVVMLASSLHADIVTPDDENAYRMGRLHQNLDLFTNGGVIVVGRGKENTCLLKQLNDDEVWEIRSRDPKPSLRLIGGFAAFNVFVGLSLFERSDLKGEGSREWRDAIVGFKAEWKRLFLSYHRHTGESFADYLSGYRDADRLP
jgi:hypothetical protein